MANRFYQNRMAIKAISEKEGVDVDIASRMYAQQQGWTGWEKEMDEWNDIQRSYMKSKTKTLADLFRYSCKNKKLPLVKGQQKLTIRGAAWYDGCAPKGDRKRRCTKRQAV